MTFQTRGLGVEARIETGKALPDLSLQAPELPLQALLHIHDQLFQVVHVSLNCTSLSGSLPTPPLPWSPGTQRTTPRRSRCARADSVPTLAQVPGRHVKSGCGRWA